VYGEGFYELSLAVSRLSDHTDIIPITLSERLISFHNVTVGSVISIAGQFRSYNKLAEGKSKLMLTAFVRELSSEPDMTKNPNGIELTGYICKPPVYRTTPFNREICDVLLAVNRAYNKSDYIPAIAWGRNARFVRDLIIGERVTLSGRIQSREYQKKIDEGNVETRVAYEISIGKITAAQSADNFVFDRSRINLSNTLKEESLVP
jgi:primosomal replication protein N